MIFLTGQRASGKSHIGAALAKKLGLPHIDMDVELEIAFGKSLSAYVAAAGWPAFRKRETRLLDRLVKAATPMVVSTGGGVVLAEENRRLLCGAPLTVYLNAPAGTLLDRRLQDPQAEKRPPLLEGQDLLQEIEGTIQERDELYRACAHLVLDATRPVEELVEEIIGQVALAILRLLYNLPTKEAKK